MKYSPTTIFLALIALLLFVNNSFSPDLNDMLLTLLSFGVLALAVETDKRRGKK